MKKIIALCAIMSFSTFTQAEQSHQVKASKIAHDLVNRCSNATNQLPQIMKNADAGARYRFDPNTIEGRMGIDAYNFALKHKEEYERQGYLTTALQKCIMESSASIKRSLN